MLTQLGIIVLLSILNGFFALSELAVVAARKSKLKGLARHSKRAQAALYLAEHPNRFLSSIQVGITLITLLTGAVTGSSLTDSIVAALIALDLPSMVAYASTIGTLIGFVLATFIQIVVGELVPKRLALTSPELLATVIAVPMRWFGKVCSPFVWLLNATSGGILRLLRVGNANTETVSEDEIRMLVAEGTEQGVLDDDERNMVNRVLRLGDRNIDSIMTPRPRITWLDASAPLEDNLEVIRTSEHSTYPVYRGDESDVVGTVAIKHLADSLLHGDVSLLDHVAKPFYVPATTRALDLLGALRDAKAKCALVVDEYGDIEGLVTLNDLLEAVIGQGSIRRDTSSMPWQQDAEGGWLVDGSMDNDDLRELLDLGHLPHEDEHDYNTLAGMLMHAFGRIPKEGEAFTWHGFEFTVTRQHRGHIQKVRVKRVAGSHPPTGIHAP